MKRTITQLARGVLDARRPRLQLLTEPVSETVLCGQSLSGSLVLCSMNNLPLRGLVYAEHERIEIPENSFGGLRVEIPYAVHAEDLAENAELKGSFRLVTNGGDAELPYCFKVCQPILLENEVPDNAGALGIMAVRDPEMTLRLFQSDSFLQLPLLQEDDSLKSLYLALRRSPDHKLALEEFLAACGAKEPCTVTADTEPISFSYGEGSCFLELRQETEGYPLVTLSTGTPFIHISRERWSGRDFSAGICRVPLSFRRSALHSGKNLGSVTVSTGRTEQTVPVTVTVEVPELENAAARRLEWQNRLKLVRSMIALYGSRNPAATLGTELLRNLDVLEYGRRPDTRGKLLRAEIYRALNRQEDEKLILDEIRADVQRKKAENLKNYLWFLYLEEELERGSGLSDSFLRLVYRLEEKDWNCADILPLIFRADPEWFGQPEKILKKIRELYASEGLNLLLRAEACAIYNELPEAMDRLEPFERELLLYGTRYDYWNEAMAKHAAELITEEKASSGAYVHALQVLYGRFPLPEILYALLSLLLRAGEPAERHHSWYALGIREDVHLADLYEYYLCTLPEEPVETVPQMVLLYYTYNSPKRYEARLKLYRFILEKFSTETHLYRLYEKQMQNFALEQLLAGNRDGALAPLYERMFIPGVLEEKTARILSELLYTEQLYLENRSIEQVLLVYGELKNEQSYPVEDGKAFVPVYARGARALYVDRAGNRYTRTELKRKRFMKSSPELVAAVRDLCPEAMPFRMADCRGALESPESSAEGREMVRQSISWEELSEAFREKLVLSLIRREEGASADSLPVLHSLKDSPYLDKRSGRLLTESFIRLEDDAAAVELMHRFGFEGFKPELLLQLLKRQIRSSSYAFEKSRFALALSLYREGQYNATTLTYLCCHFNGGTGEMRTLLERTQEAQGLVKDLPERLLAQMLFTGETDGMETIAELYMREAERPDRTVMHAYAVVQCDRYFREERTIPDSVFAYVRDWAEAEKKPEYLPVICQIALTKYDSGRESLSPEECELDGKLLTYLYNQGLLFPYEKKLGRFLALPAELSDKTLIEYRGSSELSTEIGIRILPREAGEPLNFTEMPHVFRGIYVKPVLLFADEILEYEIRTVSGDEYTTVQQGSLRLDLNAEPTQNRFTHLNRILAEAGDGNDPDWRDSLLDYGREDVLLKDYFHTV